EDRPHRSPCTEGICSTGSTRIAARFLYPMLFGPDRWFLDLLHHRGKHLFHRQPSSASRQRNLLLAAVSPDGMRYAAKRRQALVIASLVAVIDGNAGESSVAVVFVGADGTLADVG